MAGNTTISTMAVKLVGEVRDYETKMQQASRVTRESAGSITSSLNGAARGTRTFNEAQNLVARTSRLTGMRLQQAGYQVQDFFVQVGSGTSAMRAFTQQAPQFLGVFGPAGAIAGAALAIGAVVTQIVMAGRETNKSAAALKTYAEYARELHQEMEKVRFANLQPTAQKDELLAQIKARKEEIRALLVANNELKEAQKQLPAVQQSIANRSGNLGGVAITPGLGPDIRDHQGEIDTNLAKIAQAQIEMQKLQARVEELTNVEADKAADEAKKKLDEMRSSAEAIIQRNLTPLEKFNQAIKELDVLSERRLLTATQYNREVERLQAELNKAVQKQNIEPTSDRFRQLGLLTDPLRKTGPTQQETEEKKQTTILEQIKTILERTPLQPNERLTQGALWLA